MSLKLAYDYAADRMRLTVQLEGQDNRTFWLNRHHCLELLATIAVVSKSMDITLKPIAPLKTIPPRPKKEFGPDDPAPESLLAIRLRKDGEWLKILFLQSKENGISLSLKPDAVTKIHHMLATQATRAGWDPIAGLNRLNAIAKARRAQKKTQYQ